MHAAATTAVAISVVLIMALSALYYSQNTSSFGNPGNLTLTQSSQSGIPTG